MMNLLTREELEAKVIELAAKQAEVDSAEVSLKTNFRVDLNYDSLDDVEFVMTLEEVFDIEIGDQQAERVRTVGDAVSLLSSLVASAGTVAVAGARDVTE